MSQTILIVDEESKLRDMIRVYLEQDSYRVVEAADGREALYVARHEKPDLIILDLMMPELGGYEFIRIFSKESQIPIIMLIARVEGQDKILGLELGADDYVTKPFNVRELIARMRAVLRRTTERLSMLSEQERSVHRHSAYCAPVSHQPHMCRRKPLPEQSQQPHSTERDSPIARLT